MAASGKTAPTKGRPQAKDAIPKKNGSKTKTKSKAAAAKRKQQAVRDVEQSGSPMEVDGVESDSGSDTILAPSEDLAVTAQDTEIYRAVELKSVSGGLLTNDPIVFSADASLFYLAKDNAVAVYNVQNAEMVQNFSVHRDGAGKGGQEQTTISAIIADPDRSAAHQVYTFSADSMARLWDADTGTLIHTWKLDAPVTHAVIDPTRNNRFFCAVRYQKDGKKQAAAEGGEKSRNAIASIVLDQEEKNARMVELFRITSAVAGLVVRHDGQWIAAYSRFRVHLAQIKPNGKVVQHKWRMIERVSAIAFHPGEPVLAVGDWRGRIMFWYCIDDTNDSEDTEDRTIVRRPHHWHAHRVNAITFSEAGTMMLSGGEEGVLVFWQLATDTKDFLPRLGSDIMGIAASPDQMYYAVTLRDNTIRIISSLDKSLVSSLQGLKYAERGAALRQAKQSTPEYARLARMLEADPFTTGLVVHPATHHLVLNGEPGHLQVFNHVNDRHLASVEIASFNRTAGSQSSSHTSQPHVDLVQYSSDGTWMATVDSRRSDPAYGPMAVTESYLKFWKLDPSDQTYKLATRIDNPHIRGVQAIAFQPVVRKSGAQGRADASGMLCVSTGRDRTFRVWELQTLPSTGGGEPHCVWTCRTHAHYRGQQPRGAAFSADGSTLAVTFGGVVTLWDAATCVAPVGTLVASAATPTLTGVSFVGSTSYLAAWSADRLDVWNMLTGSVWWTLAMPIQSVFVHQRHALLAVAAYQIPGHSSASILVLSPASPSPLVALQQPGGVEAIALVPSASSSKSGRSQPDTEHGQPKPDPLAHNSLVVLTQMGLLDVYAAESEALAFAKASETARSAKAADPKSHALDHSAFASIFGSSAKEESAKKAELPAPSANAHVRSAMRLVRSAVQSAYVNAPYHVLPPIASLFDQFVTAQFQPKTESDERQAASAKDAAEKVDEDVEMADAADALSSADADSKPVSNKAFLKSMRAGFSAATNQPGN
ncbi:WD40 repeat-like protein [Martensiomyces pterosporus]|nr:WD40 repeat-like protein [Martensiomyces pterosporus]